MAHALIAIDVQNDFCPGGALAVTEVAPHAGHESRRLELVRGRARRGEVAEALAGPPREGAPAKRDWPGRCAHGSVRPRPRPAQGPSCRSVNKRSYKVTSPRSCSRYIFWAGDSLYTSGTAMSLDKKCFVNAKKALFSLASALKAPIALWPFPRKR